MTRVVGACLCSLWVAGCVAAHSNSSPPTRVAERELRCARDIPVESPYRMPLAGPESDPAGMLLLDVLPAEARRTARAAGLEPLLVRLLGTQQIVGGPVTRAGSLEVLDLRHELDLRLLAFDSQLASLAFEVECTRGRIADLLRHLHVREGHRQLNLAVASLVVGAGTGVAAGVVDLAHSPGWLASALAISGSATTAALGSAALLVPEQRVFLEHAHNLLRPIRDRADPEHLYPSFVFNMLTAQYPGENAPPTRLQVDLERTVRSYVPHSHYAAANAILFGEGGLYPRALLEARLEMLHHLRSAVQGVVRSLELLDRSLVRVLIDAPRNGDPP